MLADLNSPCKDRKEDEKTKRGNNEKKTFKLKIKNKNIET